MRKVGLQFFANKAILKQSDNHLKKPIKSRKERLADHVIWICEPTLHDKEWDAKTPEHQAGWIKHLQHEIEIFKRNIKEAEEELQKRGVTDE